MRKILLLVLFLSGCCNAASYYVDATNGDDDADGSTGSPWQTCEKVITTCVGGDNVYLRDGSYDWDNLNQNENNTDWITIQPDTGHSPTMNYVYERALTSAMHKFVGLNFGAGNNQGHGTCAVDARSCDHLQFIRCNFVGDGFTAGDGSCAIYPDSVDNLHIEDCNVEGNNPNAYGDYGGYDYGIYMGGGPCDDVNVIDSNFTDCRHGITAFGKRWTITGNSIHDIEDDAIRLNDMNDSTISDNHIWNLMGGQLYGDEVTATYTDSTKTIAVTDPENPFSSITFTSFYRVRIYTTSGGDTDPNYYGISSGTASTIVLQSALGSDIADINKLDIVLDNHADCIQTFDNTTRYSDYTPVDNITIENNHIHNSMRQLLFFGWGGIDPDVNDDGGGHYTESTNTIDVNGTPFSGVAATDWIRMFYTEGTDQNYYDIATVVDDNTVTIQTSFGTPGEDKTITQVVVGGGGCWGRGATNVTIRNNLCYDGGMASPDMDTVRAVGFRWMTGTVANNTFICKVAAYTGSELDVFANNICRIFNIESDATAAPAYLNYNIVQSYTYDLGEFGSNSQDLTTVEFQGEFTDYSNDDYTLVSDANAVDSANGTYAPGFDILGETRNGLPDIGCYEYIPPEEEESASWVSPTGCIAYWKCEESAVSKYVHDSVGNYHAASYRTTNLITTTHGIIDRAFNLNGSSDYIDCGNTFQSVLRSDFSICFWCKPDDGQPASDQYFFGYHDGGRGDDQFIITLAVSGRIVLTFAANSDLSENTTVDSLFDNGSGSWHFVCVTTDQYQPDSSHTKLRIYFDGEVVKENNVAENLDDITVSDDIMFGNASNKTNYFDGLIDNVMIFSRTLSPAEIQRLYNNGSGTEFLYEIEGNVSLSRRISNSLIPTRFRYE